MAKDNPVTSTILAVGLVLAWGSYYLTRRAVVGIQDRFRG